MVEAEGPKVERIQNETGGEPIDPRWKSGIPERDLDPYEAQRQRAQSVGQSVVFSERSRPVNKKKQERKAAVEEFKQAGRRIFSAPNPHARTGR